MTIHTISPILALIAVNVLFVPSGSAQDKRQESSKSSPGDYPDDQEGIVIGSGDDWSELAPELPQKSRLKHGAGAALTYGAIPANAVSEYAGLRSATEIHWARPVICLCHVPVLPGSPVLVKLHTDSNHGIRVLDGGRMPPIGGKIIEAKKSDIIPTELRRPENGIWLLRPIEELPDGEYALMLNAQNLSIFTFSVAKQSSNKGPSSK